MEYPARTELVGIGNEHVEEPIEKMTRYVKPSQLCAVSAATASSIASMHGAGTMQAGWQGRYSAYEAYHETGHKPLHTVFMPGY